MINRLFYKVKNLGVAAEDDEGCKLGKRLHNMVYVFALVFNVFSVFPLFIGYVEFWRLVVIYVVINEMLVLVGLYLNWRERFELSLQLIPVLIGLNTYVFTLKIFYSLHYVPLSVYILVKILFLFIFWITILVRFSIKERTWWNLVLLVIMFFSLDFVLFEVLKIRINTNFGKVAIVIFNFLLVVEYMFYILANSYFILQREHYEEKIGYQNERLQKALELLEQKQELLRNNIKAAEQFYRVLLPETDILSLYFKDYFVLYKPTMYLSGDFYYFRGVGDRIYVMLADSLGHGVSGAFLSVYAISTLEKYKNLFDRPSQILNELKREIGQFRRQAWNVDIAFDLAVMDFNRQTKRLVYSSASINILVVRNGELEVLEHSLFSVSGMSLHIDFKDRFCQLRRGDLIYLYTDGIVGLYKLLLKEGLIDSIHSFKQYLSSLYGLSFLEQRAELERLISLARENNLPMDDISVIGLEV